MPSGYTCYVQDGKIETLREFAMLCARAMGVCISMRDDPMDKPVPERFEPNTTYYDELISKSDAKVAIVGAMSPAECEKKADEVYEEAVQAWNTRRTRRAVEEQRYRAMIAKVEAWSPPEVLDGLRQFMLDQLNESLRFDCGHGDYDKPPRPQTGPEWQRDTIEKAQSDLDYGREHRAEEIKRTKERNAWLAALRTSLAREDGLLRGGHSR